MARGVYPNPAARARMMAWEWSATCSLVKMVDTWPFATVRKREGYREALPLFLVLADTLELNDPEPSRQLPLR